MVNKDDLSDYVQRYVTKRCGGIVKRVHAEKDSNLDHEHLYGVSIEYHLVGWTVAYERHGLNPDRVAAEGIVAYLKEHPVPYGVVVKLDETALKPDSYIRNIILTKVKALKSPRLDRQMVKHPRPQRHRQG